MGLNVRGEVAVAEVVSRMASAVGVEIARPTANPRLTMTGLGGSLSKTLLSETLGPGVAVAVERGELLIRIEEKRLGPDQAKDWRIRLTDLTDRIQKYEERSRDQYGMHALKSYRANDPARPTVCLIHGLNSTSSVFWHMVRPIEEAGYGLVVYDFPYNRGLNDSARAFERDWAAFRKETGDARPWAIVSHSMGGLLARGYVEGDGYRGDVASLVLIAPVNGGSDLSQAQTLLQIIQGLKAIQRKPGARDDALARLGDGLGAAAADMVPGSPFLRALNGRGRRSGVPYHILAGSRAFLTATTRRTVDEGLGITGKPALLGKLARLASSRLVNQLDEITDGTGDGCVSIESTRLEGVTDHHVLPGNHLELIRAPLLFPDPGPVLAMPEVLRRLRTDLPPMRELVGPPHENPKRQGVGGKASDR